jgi:DNA repair exonuclease SbcCD ATPase subunit
MTDDLPVRVAAAAEALEAEGIRPTIARVRERVQASANRVHQALQAWQEERTRQQRQQALPTDAPVPPALRVALDAVLAAHVQILGQELDRERMASRSVQDRLADELEAERAVAREAATEAQENAAALVAAADEAEARAEKLIAELSERIRMQEGLRIQLANAARRLEAAEARAERAEERADVASAGWREESVARAVAERASRRNPGLPPQSDQAYRSAAGPGLNSSLA